MPGDDIEDVLAKLAAVGSQPNSARALQAEHAVRVIRAALSIMEPAQRVAVFEMIADGYCTHCGGLEPPICQCTNDE